MWEIFLNDRKIILADAGDPSFLYGGLTGTEVNDRETLSQVTGQFLHAEKPLLLLTGSAEWLWPAFRSLFLLLPAAGGVVKSEKGFLFIFRKGYWDLPKGKIDENETPEEAALREVREETGLMELTITGICTPTWHIYQSPWKKDQGKWILKETKWYAMIADGNQVLVPEQDEDIERVLWVDISELKMIQDNTYSNLKNLISLLPGL